jgi:hypothetical protein
VACGRGVCGRAEGVASLGRALLAAVVCNGGLAVGATRR